MAPFPSPSPWVYIPDEVSGCYYYANLSTGETQWERPESLDHGSVAVPAAERNGALFSPNKWVEHFDQESNRPYFYNESSGESTWILPADDEEAEDDWDVDDIVVKLQNVKNGMDGNAQAVVGADDIRQNALRRAKVFEEILATEQVYVSSLMTLKRVYVDPLRMVAGAKNGAIFSHADLDAIFLNIDVIAKLHAEFLDELTVGGAARCADTFAAATRRFKGCYTRYISNTDSAQAILRKIRLSADKADVEKWRFLTHAKSHPEMAGQDLTSFLIKPVQKMIHYKLMLEQLLKHTDAGAPEQPKVAAALAAVSELAQIFNEDKRATEDFRTLRETLSRFVDSDAILLRTELLSYERKFVREGELVKQRFARRQRRSLILLSDCLLYGKPSPTLGSSGGIVLKGRIGLYGGTRVESLPSTGDTPHAFAIVEPDGKGYTWLCDSAEQKNGWLASLQQCITGEGSGQSQAGAVGGDGVEVDAACERYNDASQTIEEASGSLPAAGGELKSRESRSTYVVASKSVGERIALCRAGTVLTKYNKADGKAKPRWVKLQRHKDGTVRLRWGDQRTQECKSDVNLSEALGLMHGARSGSFFMAGRSKQDHDWQCFSIVFKERTLDFAAPDMEQLADWYLALAALVPASSTEPLLDEASLNARLHAMGAWSPDRGAHPGREASRR